jgi:hypothetical protein
MYRKMKEATEIKRYSQKENEREREEKRDTQRERTKERDEIIHAGVPARVSSISSISSRGDGLNPNLLYLPLFLQFSHKS